MKKLFAILFLSNLVLSNNLKKVEIHLNNFQNVEWWSRYNNNGLSLKESFLSLSYNEKFKYSQITFNSFASSEDYIIGESLIIFDLPKNNKLKVGRFYRDFSSYLNDELSSGSMLISKNAMPIPKIGFFGEYQLKKRTSLQFNYGISHGILSKNHVYKKAPFLHEKFIYLKRNKNNNEFGIGFVHEAIWAGGTFENGNFPIGFNSFLKILISADGKKKINEPHANALGNHLGIWDFYFSKNSLSYKLKLYHQHLFEDTSGLRFANSFDGLWGFEYSDLNSNINFLFEFINTINQNNDPPYVSEAYYNHGEYSLGWSYKGYVIGNPFLSNISPNPSQIMHFGISSIEENFIDYKFIISRRVNIFDTLKYSILLEKKINSAIISFYLNGEKNTNYGLKLAYEL